MIHSKKFSSTIMMSAAVSMVMATTAFASEIRYRPVNPHFGGNPLNSTHLQFEASSNNQHQDDDRLSTQDTIADLVKRSVSFQLADQINTELFGGTDPNGTFLLGDGTSISYVRGTGTITITFIGVDGTTTTFVVPD